MRKVIGVGAVLLLAGAVMAPANAAPVATDVRTAVSSTVAVEAPADAVVTFESPTVETVAAPEPVAEVAPVVEPVAAPEVVPVAPVAAVAPTVQTAEAGGTVEETVTPVEVVPVVAEPVPATVEPEPEPEPVPPATVPTPTTTEESEVQAPITSTDSQEYIEGMSFLLPGEVYGGSYVGDSSAWVAAGNRVVVSQTIHRVDPEVGPLGPTLDVFHVYAPANLDAPTPEDLLAQGTGTK